MGFPIRVIEPATIRCELNRAADEVVETEQPYLAKRYVHPISFPILYDDHAYQTN